MIHLRTAAALLICFLGGISTACEFDPGRITGLQVNRCAKGDIAAQ